MTPAVSKPPGTVVRFGGGRVGYVRRIDPTYPATARAVDYDLASEEGKSTICHITQLESLDITLSEDCHHALQSVIGTLPRETIRAAREEWMAATASHETARILSPTPTRKPLTFQTDFLSFTVTY